MRLELWPHKSLKQHYKEMSLIVKNGSLGGEILSDTLVFERKDKTLGGFIEISVRGTFLEHKVCYPIAYIVGYYVDKDITDRRIDEQLVQEAKKWAFEKGCIEMITNVKLHNYVECSPRSS